MREADLSMIEDVERRAVREWCSKNDKRQILLAAQFRKNKFRPQIVTEALDRFEYQDMITDFWRNRLPE
jgi:hypothetical protein